MIAGQWPEIIIAGRRFELAMAVLVSLVSVNGKSRAPARLFPLTGTKEARTAIADEDRAVLSILYCEENMLKIEPNRRVISC